MNRAFLAACASAAVSLVTVSAAADGPSSVALQALGARSVEMVSGPRALRSFLVRVPAEIDPIAYGLKPIVPGIAFIDGDAARIAGFAAAHPSFEIELAPPMMPKLDLAGPFVGATALRASPAHLDGTGTYVGIIDTGLDVFHPDFRNADGTTRVAWFLDMSQPARAGNALDDAYKGRVFDRAALDVILTGSPMAAGVPTDREGHGTHVAGIAAGNGGTGKRFVGMAPNAELVIVRASRGENGAIDEADAVLGTKFVFDMAAAVKKPAAVNLSLGSQFGPHDGSSAFERGLSALALGAGRAVVVAASNEGGVPIHTSVRVSRGARFRVPVRLPGTNGKGLPYTRGSVYTWLNWRDGGDVRVGLRAPDGSEWMEPIERGRAVQSNPTSGVTVQIVNDTGDPRAIPQGTQGAWVVWKGAIPVGEYELLLEGDGAVEMWLQGAEQAIDGPGMPFFARGGQIEGTIGVPASAAGVIAVGCVGLRTLLTDRFLTTYQIPEAFPGGRCYFSSAGPAANGILRPDVLAPGHFVVSSMASAALAASPGGMFGREAIVDAEHAALAGTSMSSPFGAGAAVLLFQKDPTLTQEDVRAALHAGARPLVDDLATGSPRDYAKGAGILDVEGAVAALDRRAKSPVATKLQLRLGGSYLAADGRLPLYVLVFARDDAGRPAEVVDGLALQVEGASIRNAVEHPLPGLYRFALVAAPNRGGTDATIRVGRGALSLTQQVPIAADRWDARDGNRVGGGCSTSHGPPGASGWVLAVLASLGGITVRRRRSRLRSHGACPADRPGGRERADRPC